MAKKFIRVGTVMSKRDGTGRFITLGNPKAPNEAYRYTVDIRVRDGKGNVVAQSSDCLLSLTNPRNRPGITEDQLGKIPQLLENEITLVIED